MKKVRVSLGRTIQLKQYESLRVDVSIEDEADESTEYFFKKVLNDTKTALKVAMEEAKRDCA